MSDAASASPAPSAVPVEKTLDSSPTPEKISGNVTTTEATPTAPVPKAEDSTPASADDKTNVTDASKPAPVTEASAIVNPPPTAKQAQDPSAMDIDSDDDLDELDDMLDEFEVPSPSAVPKEKAAPEAGATLDEEWAKQLQAGMADLLSDMADNDEMQAQFNALAKELNDAMASGTPEPSTAPKIGSSSQSMPAPASAPDANDFQAQIKAAMDRMKNSETNVNAAVQDAESDDFLAEILKQMQSGAGAGNDEDFSGMLVNMMEQLTSKEILYEPMKELSDKYPEWLAKNSGKEKEQDMKRYREQYTVVKEIVDKFEETTYKDDNEADREYIVERMQKMQSAGAPPTELMGDVPPELSLPDDVDPDCGVQ